MTNEVKSFPLLPNETIMEDDSNMFFMYLYIFDGVFSRNEKYHAIKVSEFKQRENVREVRKCNIFGPGRNEARLGDRVIIPPTPTSEEKK
jgi:hypothetical protein